MHRTKIILLAALCVSATTGCKKKVKLDDLDEELAVVTCQKLYECCDEAEIEQAQGFLFEFEDEESCTSAYDSLMGLVLIPSIKSAVDNGRAEYDARAAADCLREYESVSCEDAAAGGGDFACAEIIVPLLDEGDTCRQDFECKSGSCYMPDFEADEGECRTLPGDGEPCLEREEDGFTFTDCAEGLSCVDDVCTSPKEEGAECTSSSGCLSRECVDGACGPLKEDGESCFGDEECASGLCDTEDFTCGAGSGGGCGLL